MAGQQQQLLGQVQNEQTALLPTWAGRVLFGDVPTPEGMVILQCKTTHSSYTPSVIERMGTKCNWN